MIKKDIEILEEADSSKEVYQNNNINEQKPEGPILASAPPERSERPGQSRSPRRDPLGREAGEQRPGRQRRRSKFNDRRPRLATQRRLPPTHIHEGKIGAPKDANGDGTLKIIALGGLGEIGKNMYMLEYKDDIIIIDCGIMFPEENMPGIDFIIPNTGYLEGKQQNIRGLILTHGHMDHIGAVPYLQQKLGNPDIYTAALTRGIVLKRHLEFPQLPKLNI